MYIVTSVIHGVSVHEGVLVRLLSMLSGAPQFDCVRSRVLFGCFLPGHSKAACVALLPLGSPMSTTD